MYHTVTSSNFGMLYPQIEKLVKESEFLSLHVEFSGGSKLGHEKFSFPNCEMAYHALRKEVENLLVFQFALCVFTYNSDTNDYSASIYRFYLRPRDLYTCRSKKYSFQSSYIDKLCDEEFDFNEFGYQGISYLTKKEENSLRSDVKDGKFFKSVRKWLSIENQNILHAECSRVAKWYIANGDNKSFLKLVPQWKTRMDHLLFNNILSQEIKQSSYVSTVFNNEEIMVTRIPHNHQKLLASTENVEKLIESYTEFSKIVKLITSCGKPLIGCNIPANLLGLFLHSYESFPESYTEFKEEFLKLYGTVYDVKYVASQLYNFIPKEDIDNTNNLERLYNYLMNSSVSGNAQSSLLSEKTKAKLSKYIGNRKYIHEVGFRSFMYGYVFIKISDAISKLQNRSNNTDRLKVMEMYRNRIFVESDNINYINLEGKDDEPETQPLHVLKYFSSAKHIFWYGGALGGLLITFLVYGRQR